MDKLQCHRIVYLTLILCVFLLASTEMGMVEAKVCPRYSQTWTGICLDSSKCDRQCKDREDARSGACHRDSKGLACFCYFDC